MLNIKDTYAKVWKVEDKGKYKQIQLSTSRKKQDGTWENMYWNARLVGKANVALAEKSKIKITNAIMENSYNKETKKAYYNLVIFELEIEGQAKQEESWVNDAMELVEVDGLPF